jgi:transcription antitermination factor NusG
MAGYETYCPRIRERGAVRVLFPNYLFIVATAAWYTARWTVGVAGLIGFDGREPTRIADAVVAELRTRERNGLVELPSPPGFRRGDRVRITRGVFAGQLARFDGMRSHERVAALLQLLGRVELAKGDIAPAR